MKKLSGVLLVAALAALAFTQCSSYCKSCSGGGTNGGYWNPPGIVYTCQSCPSNFNSSGTNSICFVDTNHYLLEMELANGDFTLNNTSIASCGSVVPSAVPGFFNPTDIVQIYVSTTMLNHYLVRVRGSVIFVDKWIGTNSIMMQVDNSTKATLTYSQGTKIGCQQWGWTPPGCPSPVNVCGSQSVNEVYGVYDSN